MKRFVGSRIASGLLVIACAAAFAACSGDDGAPGSPGPTGVPGSPGTPGPAGPPGASTGSISGRVTDAATGSALAGASVRTEPASVSATAGADGGFVLSNVPVGVYEVRATAAGYQEGSKGNVSVVVGGTATANLALSPAPLPASVSGKVIDSGTAPVAQGEVVLIGTQQVASSAVTVEEPLAALEPSSEYRAVTGADGSFSIAGVAPGPYFVYVKPGDADRLPGGSRSREATFVVAGVNDLGTIEVSQQPSASATYVGSTTCLTGCHATGVAPNMHGWTQTVHAMTYRVPGQYTANMDPSQFPRHDVALGDFFDGNPKDTTGTDDYGMLLTGISSAYDVLIGNDGRYFAVLRAKDGSKTSERYYVDFTFGGEGVWKQRFVTRVAGGRHVPPGQGSYYILPIQYDERMQEGLGVKPWTNYNPGNWGAPAEDGGPAAAPAPAKSFDLNCAGCHFTGTKLIVDGQGNYRADAVDDPNGPLDYDGDGTLDEISEGCEVCHGPGSDHVANPGRRIIVPGLLSAERASMICGQCHVRGEGKGTVAGAHTEYPSHGTDAAIVFPRAGISRAEFVEKFHVDKPGNWPDDAKNAKSHHQQYHDFVKSKHYRNPFDLLSCESCHDLHDGTSPHLVRGKAEDNSTCLGCHAPYGPFSLPVNASLEATAVAVEGHMVEAADMTAPYDPANALGLIDFGKLGIVDTPFLGGSGNCVSCHMPLTAKSQARWTKEGGASGTIIMGDITSHRFEVVRPSVSSALKLAGQTDIIPNSCGTCHNALTGVRPDLVP